MMEGLVSMTIRIIFSVSEIIANNLGCFLPTKKDFKALGASIFYPFRNHSQEETNVVRKNELIINFNLIFLLISEKQLITVSLIPFLVLFKQFV